MTIRYMWNDLYEISEGIHIKHVYLRNHCFLKYINNVKHIDSTHK